jgi:hypothetical protein
MMRVGRGPRGAKKGMSYRGSAGDCSKKIFADSSTIRSGRHRESEAGSDDLVYTAPSH